MRKLLILCGLGLALSVVGAPARADDADALRRVEQGLAALASVKAEFTQEIATREGVPAERATGTLWLRKPGHFRWEYRKPAQTLICDGEHFWLYDPELSQVTVRRIKESLSETPAMLLAGELSLREGFEVHEGGTLDGLVWSVLVPKTRDTDFREVRIGLAGSAIRRLEFVDKLNQRTRLDLSHVERNVVIPESLFHFVAPAGVDVIGNGR